MIDRFSTQHIVKASQLNVREQANASSKILRTLSRGESIKVKGPFSGNSQWLRLSKQGGGGWVASTWIETTSLQSTIAFYERYILIIVGMIFILGVSFGIPFLGMRSVLDSMGFENSHAIMFLSGLSLLFMINLMTSPITITVLTVVCLIYFLAIAVMDGYFLNITINTKLEIMMLNSGIFNQYSGIFRGLGILGVGFGVYFFISGLLATEWRAFNFLAFYKNMSHQTSSNWSENTLFRVDNAENFLAFFKALAINIASPVVSVITNFFAPWATITTATSLVRLK